MKLPLRIQTDVCWDTSSGLHFLHIRGQHPWIRLWSRGCGRWSGTGCHSCGVCWAMISEASRQLSGSWGGGTMSFQPSGCRPVFPGDVRRGQRCWGHRWHRPAWSRRWEGWSYRWCCGKPIRQDRWCTSWLRWRYISGLTSWSRRAERCSCSVRWCRNRRSTVRWMSCRDQVLPGKSPVV